MQRAFALSKLLLDQGVDTGLDWQGVGFAQ